MTKGLEQALELERRRTHSACEREPRMRGVVIAICVIAAIYAADKIAADGRYSRSLTEMTSKVWHHFYR